MLQNILIALYALVKLKVAITFESFTEQQRIKKITFSEEHKVIGFEVVNAGTNSNVLIGKGDVWYKIPAGQSKSFGLDSWFHYCDSLEYKFETTTCVSVDNCTETVAPAEHRLLLITHCIIRS